MAWELSPWRPFRELTTLRDEMDRTWERFFKEGMEPFRGEWVPSLDVSETKSDIVVKAEVPGMDPKDIDISLAGDLLTIKGEKKQEREEKDENYHRVERSYGAFTRSIRLPQEVKGDEIKAKYKNGILQVTMPKSGAAKKKVVKIKVD